MTDQGFIMICGIENAAAQTDTLDLNFGAIVFMDSVTITASRDGFNKNDFIDIIQKEIAEYHVKKWIWCFCSWFFNVKLCNRMCASDQK